MGKKYSLPIHCCHTYSDKKPKRILKCFYLLFILALFLWVGLSVPIIPPIYLGQE